MRFVLISTHIDQTTGYAKVSYNLLRQLATLSPKVKTYHFGFQRHPAHASIRKAPDGVSVYDAAANEDPKEEGFGFNKIAEYLDMVNPDVVMIYNDPLTIYRFMEAMKYASGKSPYRLWVYLDQVYEGIAPVLLDGIRRNAERVYCFSEAWKRGFLEYGPAPDVRVLEHAVDATVFSRMPSDAKAATRVSVNIPKDAIVVLNANRNSQRKRLDLSIQGFVRALVKNPKLYLMLVTNLAPQTGAYYDVQRIYVEELGLADLEVGKYLQNLVLVDTSPPNVIDDEGINQLYNVADIGLNTSDGEGFGLCQLEHLFTGAPQVVTSLASYSAFLDDAVSIQVPATGRSYFAGGMPHGHWYPTFRAEDVAAALGDMVAQLDEKKAATMSRTFKTWSKVCDEFLEDLLMLAVGPVTSVSIPVTSASPSS